MSDTIKVVIRPTVGGNAERFTVTIPSDGTVQMLKLKIAEKCSLTAEQQVLIYKGRFLKDEERVTEYGTLGGELIGDTISFQGLASYVSH
jgi:hypothetical protein